jgi:hypothetical protein
MCMTERQVWSLAGAAVVLPAGAPEVACTAAGELARYLYLLTGRVSPVVEALPRHGTAVVLDRALAASLGVGVEDGAVGDQGYRLAATHKGELRAVVIAAAAPAGVLYGVYGLLEELGMGFYAGGDTFPELPIPAEVSARLDRTERPAFRVRGNMLHYNFLCGCTTWGLNDYKFYFDQLSRMRANMLLMHWYDGEPGAGYAVNGEYLAGGVTPNTLTKPWGALAALRTSEFSFGTGRCFDEEIFSSPCGEDLPDLLTELKRSEAMFSDATRYARGAAVNVAAGFEAPRTDPTDPRERARFEARVRQFIARNPHATHFALWEHESGGCVGLTPPPAGSGGAALLERERARYAYLGNEQRVWEAIRYGEYGKIARAVLDAERADLPLVMVGWGGDRWMQFADYCLAYDQVMPDNVIFTCHDNIDASMGPNVSTPWGQLPPARERWAMPWVEGDIASCDTRQPHVLSLGKLAPDALQKGCQGLLTLQWRTRDVEEETGYIARFAWNTALTPERFYRELAGRAFGPDQEAAMAERLLTLQELCEHWTGVRGTAECSRMNWGGWVPHIPFEVGPDSADYLIPKAEAAVRALAEVPETADDEAAFHLIQDAGAIALRTDASRPGVAEMEAVVERLKALRGLPEADGLRDFLREIEETVYALRPKLVAFGMIGKSYQAIDGFLIAIHQLWRNAGAAAHMATLRRLRRELADLRAEYLSAGRLARLERLDYLTNTLDAALNFDSAVLLLADGEWVEQALAAAAVAQERDEHDRVVSLTARAYADLVAAGMDRAVAAYARKLTTRCDFGTLATINVKPLPRYWETIGRLEAGMPAVPPREVHARGKADEVWLSWEPRQAAAQHLYRRPAGTEAWARVNVEPLSGSCRMFVDTPGPGAFDYAVSAVSADGWESPRSHVATAVCGPDAPAPRLVACKPPTRLAAGVDAPVRVVVLADRDLARVTLRYRRAGETTWQGTPLIRRFRESWHGALPAGALAPGTVEYYVEAADTDGRTARWPESAPELPWSGTVG